MTLVLVTGAGGFLGSALVPELLRSGCRVRALVRNEPSSKLFPESVDVVIGDLREPHCAKLAAAGCDSVVHLAGKAHALDDDRVTEDEYRSVNVDGTKRLLDEVLAGGGRKFIFASSVKVFGEGTTGCIDEEAPPAPQTPYARSKWTAEQLLASYSKTGGLATVSFRLPLVYGPTRKGNLYRMIAAIDQGRFPPLPRVSTVRSMLHVNNFVSAVRSALESSILPKSMYVVADAEPYSVTDMYDLLREGLGRRPPSWRVPLWALLLGARCGDVLQRLIGRSAPLSSSTLQKLIGQACYSPEALIRDSGYRPRDTFRDTVPELIAYYRRSLS